MAANRVLITGATGFVGSHVARHLVARGYEVHALCRPTSTFERLHDVCGRLRAHAVELIDREAMRRVVHAIAPDYVIHLAGAVMHAGKIAPPDEIAAANILGTMSLIDACDELDYAGFVNTGDAFEYGAKRRPAKETDRCRPQTLEGMTKLIATLYARHTAAARQKPIVTLRLFSVLGPMDHQRRLVPQVIESALTGSRLRASRPDVARDYLYVADVADLYAKAMTSAACLAGAVLNVGSGRATSVIELVDRVAVLTHRKIDVDWGAFPLAPHDRGCWVADTTRLRSALDWEPRFSLERGLRATLRSYRRFNPSPSSYPGRLALK